VLRNRRNQLRSRRKFPPARNAGNLVETATLGTVVVTNDTTYPGAIGPMIEPILPAALAVRSKPGDFVNNAAKENAKRAAARLQPYRRVRECGEAEDRRSDLRLPASCKQTRFGSVPCH
jgi:hypothetical protein